MKKFKKSKDPKVRSQLREKKTKSESFPDSGSTRTSRTAAIEIYTRARSFSKKKKRGTLNSPKGEGQALFALALAVFLLAFSALRALLLPSSRRANAQRTTQGGRALQKNRKRVSFDVSPRYRV